MKYRLIWAVSVTFRLDRLDREALVAIGGSWDQPDRLVDPSTPLGIKLEESETLQADVAYCTDDGGHRHDQAVR